VQHISSRQNPIVARYRAARDRRHQTDAVLLDGAHLVQDALACGAALRDVVAAAGTVGRPDVAAILETLARARVPTATASPAVMSALSPVRSSSPIVALMERPAIEEARVFAGAAPLVVVAVDVQDPGNLGAIVRVAEAAEATGVIVAGGSADPFGWKAVRGSMGSALRLPIAIVADAVAALAAARRHGCRLLATAPRDGRSLFSMDLTTPSAVLIGGEGAGLSDALVAGADERVTIPMRSPVESLNAAVTAAVILYEARRQRST
jgi:TrmH family RNA methyltransferase